MAKRKRKRRPGFGPGDEPDARPGTGEPGHEQPEGDAGSPLPSPLGGGECAGEDGASRREDGDRSEERTRGFLAGLRDDFRSSGATGFLLVVLAFLFYANAWDVPFLFDDAPVITRNRLLWQWDTWLELVRSLPTRALTNLTFLLNFQLGRTATVQPYDFWDWAPYHGVNIALHALNGCLLFFLVRDLLRARPGEVRPGLVHWVALGGAAIWLAHPAHTMAVTYIAQRYALMSAMAFLGTLVLYVRFRLRVESARGEDAWLGSALLFVAAFLASFTCYVTKENAAVVPFALLGIELLFFRGRLWYLPPVFFVPLLFGVVLRLNQFGVEEFFPARSPTGATRGEYFTTQIWVQMRYLHLFFLPHDLCVEQNIPVAWDGKALDCLVAGAGHVLIWALGLLLLVRGQRLIPAAIGWYYLTNVVESSFIPILDPMVDHRMYLPTALLAPALLVALARGYPGLVARWTPARAVVPAVVGAVVIALGVGTVVRNFVWQSSTGIWEDTIAKRPDCARAYSSLGMEHLYAGEWTLAVGPIETALMLGPLHVEGWNNLGKAYLELKQWDEAEEALLQGIRVHELAPSPNVPLCWNNVGLVYTNKSDEALDRETRRYFLELAVHHLRRATELDPFYEVAYLNLNTAHYKLMRMSEGDARFKHAQGVIESTHGAAGVASQRGGDLPLGTKANYGVALGEAGREAEAIALLEQFLSMPQVLTRESLLEEIGRIALRARQRQAAESPALLARVAGLLDQYLGAAAAPSFSLLYVRARIAGDLGDYPTAIKALEQAIASDPGHPAADELRGQILILRDRMERGLGPPPLQPPRGPTGSQGPPGPQGPAGPPAPPPGQGPPRGPESPGG